MSRRRRPLAALALIAMVVLISACGSSAPAGTGGGSGTQHRRQCSEGGEVRRVHAQQRGQRVPGPERVGQVHHRCGSERLVAGHEHPGVQAGHQRVQGPGASGVHGQQAELPAAGRRPSSSPSASAHNGVKDFPDPTQMGPSSTRIESHPPQGARWDEHSQRRDAEVPRCGSRSGGDGPVRRKTWVLAAAAVLVAVSRHRRRGSSRPAPKQAGRGRAAAAGEHRAGGEEDALGDGLPGRDPDLSGAIGRLAVLRDQPGPRDIHQAARGRPGDLLRVTCSTG